MKVEVSLNQEYTPRALTGGHANLADLCFDSSCLRDCMGCPRYFWLRYMKGVSTEASSIAADFGTLIHKGLYVWHDTGDLEAAQDTMRDFERRGDQRRTSNHAYVWMHDYVAYYGSIEEEEFKVIEAGGRKALEVDFDLTIPLKVPWAGGVEAEVRLRGRIDMGIEARGGLWVWDNKTASQVPADPTEVYTRDFQFDTYYFAFLEVLGECKGVVVNIFGTGGKHKYGRFKRAWIVKRERENTDYRENLNLWLLTILWWDQLGWPQARTHCSTWGGCRYRMICDDFLSEERWGDFYIVQVPKSEKGVEKDDI